MSVVEERCIALAGAFQAAAEVRRIGREGNAGSAALEATIRSLFVFDPGSVPEVFGGVQGLHSGLPALRNFLAHRGDRTSLEISRYALGLIRLERRVQATAGSGAGTLVAIRGDLDALVDQGLAEAPTAAVSSCG